MIKNNSPSLLSGVTFEEIMSEAEVSSDRVRRDDSTSHKKAAAREAKQSNSTIEFRIIKNFGTLSKKKNAATFALVDWNGYERYDLRSWSDDYSTPYKGISFTGEELAVLRDMLSCYSHRIYTQPQYICDLGKTKAKIFYNICNLSSSKSRGITWYKQVCIVDWGYGQKFDFRKWTEGYDKCGKGICLSKDEATMLLKMINTLNL